MSLLKRYFVPVTKLGGSLITNYFGWMLPYKNKANKENFEIVYPKFLKFMDKVDNALNVEYHIEGLENLNSEEHYYFVSNHLGLYDPILIMTKANNPTAFIAKVETSKVPGLSCAFKALGGAFIDRNDLKATLRVMRDTVEKDMAEDYRSWGVFPEGTRSRDPMKQPIIFHAGTFRAPVHQNYPIVPVAIFGGHRVLKAHKVYKHYPVWVKFLKPLMPEDYKGMSTEEIATYCHDEINKALAFDLRRKDHDEMTKLNDNYDLYHQL